MISKSPEVLLQAVCVYLQFLERWPEITFQSRSAIWEANKPTSTALGMVRSCLPENAGASVAEQVIVCVLSAQHCAK